MMVLTVELYRAGQAGCDSDRLQTYIECSMAQSSDSSKSERLSFSTVASADPGFCLCYWQTDKSEAALVEGSAEPPPWFLEFRRRGIIS